MKIAIIGPGLLPIPPIGWGAIESLIWKYKNKLTELGHEVIIFNSKDLEMISNTINKSNFDFVHLQFDDHVHFFERKLKVPFCITMHNGYILKTKRWKPSYYSIFKDSLCTPGIIALSEEIFKNYANNKYDGFIKILRNGTSVKDFNFINKGNGKAICLGKIEPRKKQAIIAEKLDGLINIDFVGPIADVNFKEGKTTKYLGVWDRQTVFSRLTEYNSLILLSEGEAAPLVTVEALAAGLSLVVSSSASSNISKNNFIDILPDNCNNFSKILEVINNNIKNNQHQREEIREFAMNRFDENVIIKEYINIILDFISYSKSKKYKNFYELCKKIKKNILRYYFSRLYFKMNHYKFLKLFKWLYRKEKLL